MSLQVSEHEVVAIMGPSGCGKTTLLRLLAGLAAPSAGSIRHTPDEDRVFLGFQDFDAFPWLRVETNVQVAGACSTAEPILGPITAILERVGLHGQGSKYPRQLSGGMRKRLALARLLASRARIVLLDEAFSSLDVAARYEMQNLVQNITQSTPCAMVVITHDVEEAAFLASRVLICSGPPLTVAAVLNVAQGKVRDHDFRSSAEFVRAADMIRRTAAEQARSVGLGSEFQS